MVMISTGWHTPNTEDFFNIIKQNEVRHVKNHRNHGAYGEYDLLLFGSFVFIPMIVFSFFRNLVKKVEQNAEFNQIKGYEWQVPSFVKFESRV